MSEQIDIKFDFYSDSPSGKDPDTYSPTLRQYHKLLWSKPLPNGVTFGLADTTPKVYLHHQSDLGDFRLSSDAFGHTYKNTKKMAHIINQIPSEEIDSFFAICSTIGAYIIFPSNRIEGKMTINGARGCSAKIGDRFDLTLECIRLHYVNGISPLGEVFQRYSDFFDLFRNFQGYVDFFLLQDLVAKDYATINFWVPFNSFDDPPLPTTVEEYQVYKRNVTDSILARNQRMVG
jgi:hypothetical protein